MQRGYYYCTTCNQQRLSGWIENGKCTRCENGVKFVETDPSLTMLRDATTEELVNELIKHDDMVSYKHLLYGE